MKIEEPLGPKKCPICLRTKKDALTKQVQIKEPCPYNQCPFKEDIKLAVEQAVLREHCTFTIHPKRKI